MAIAKLVKSDDIFHGVPVLEMHVDDPIPLPRAPTRYAVRITPDLARYLLTFNHPSNRKERKRKVTQMAGDMAAGRWHFTPESIVFSASGVLQNGQNRLLAITEYGSPVWMMVDFGWPDELITIIDRGSARTNQDALAISGEANTAITAALVSVAWRYDRTVGTTRQWSGFAVPSSAEVVALVNEDHERIAIAAKGGRRVYVATAHGASASVWAGAYYLIGRSHPEKVAAFFDEITDGTGEPNSATRWLRDWFLRRPASQTRTGDSREPLELMIRAFNAWKAGKRIEVVKLSGFPLSRIK